MMHTLKKTAALLLSAALILSLAACSGTQESSSAPSQAASSQAASSASSQAPEESSADPTDFSDIPGVFSGPLDENGYFKNVDALAYVTLPDIGAIEVPESVSTVSETEVEAEVDGRLANYITQQHVTDRAVQDGDSVNIDYVGSIDGVEFPGGSTAGNGTTVTIGVTNYIDDFLEQLIGHRPGETFDVNVTFPEDYGVDSLNGQDAVFVTTINYIAEDYTPTLTDEFVAENWSSEGWTTAAQARAGLAESLRQVAVGNYLWEQIQELAEVREIPAPFVRYQEAVLTNYYATMAASSGVELEDFLRDTVGVDSMETIFEQSRAALDENAKASLLMQALGQKMDVRPTDEDITRYFLRNMSTEDWSSYQEHYGRPYLALLTREDMVKRLLGQ